MNFFQIKHNAVHYTHFDESGTDRAQTFGSGPSLFIDGPEPRVCARSVPLSSKRVYQLGTSSLDLSVAFVVVPDPKVLGVEPPGGDEPRLADVMVAAHRIHALPLEDDLPPPPPPLPHLQRLGHVRLVGRRLGAVGGRHRLQTHNG